MSAENSWNAVGRVGRDCELRYTDKGDPIGSWSLAVKFGFGESAKTQWVNCSLFGKRAESLKPYILKGGQMAIQGEIFVREWVNKEGVNKANLECRVADISLIGGAKSDGQAASTPTGNSTGNSTHDPMDGVEDDIPF
jgi:single-strand DNA-binding protein